MVIYRDASGKAVGAYDLLTGKMETMQATGIIEFDMTDGCKYEMRYYATVKDWLDAVSGSQGDVLWRTDNREQAVNMFLMDTDSRSIAWGKEIQKIVGRNVHSGIIVAYPPSGSKFFVIGTTEVGRGTAAMVRGQDKAYRADYVDAPIGEVDAAIVPAGQNATP